MKTMLTNKFKDKKAVMFDFGDTLATTLPSYPERIEMAIRESGFDFESTEYIEAYMKADYLSFVRYKLTEKISNRNRLEWLFEILTEELNLRTDPYELMASTRKNMNKIKFTRRIAFNGVQSTLEHLREEGFKLAVVSNNDGRVEQKCEDVGIRKFFDVIVDSGNIGIIKPESGIFYRALENLALDTSEVVHIGDLYGADVLGAYNAGIDAIWFNQRRSRDYENTGVVQIRKMSELPGLLSSG